MRAVFVDTSAAFALLVSSDARHEAARRSFERLSSTATPLLTTSYVLIETAALLGRRVGLDAVRRFHEDLVPLFEVVWVDDSLHYTGLGRLLEGRSQDLSLVDAVSFVVMRNRDVEVAFAFDGHYDDEGFARVD